MIDLRRIAAAHYIQGAVGETGLDLHHLLSFSGGLFWSVAKQLKHFLHMHDILLAQIFGLFVFAEVVVAFRQSHATLVHFRDHATGILEVRTGAHFEERVHALTVQSGELLHSIFS